MSKNKKNRKGVVFSTNPDYEYSYQEDEQVDDLPKNQQKLRILLDRKQRKGKRLP